MALRRIRTGDDEVLRKKAREVDEINDRMVTLVKDMRDTMYHGNGVGLAAPQVGILKRVVVIDVGEGLVEMINPRIVKEKGEQIEAEGCLSVPGVFGEVKRPAHVTAEYQDCNGRKRHIEAKGLLAKVVSHEIDHLEGILFTDKVIRYVDMEEMKKEKN